MLGYENNTCVLLDITENQHNHNTDTESLAAATWAGIGLELLYS